MSNRAFIVFSVVITIVIAALIYLFQPHWTGITAEEHGKVIGRYSTFEACQEEVRKIGGWCGKGCTEYPDGPVADCNSLIKIEKLK